jgi:surfeit locus 1 family protein
MKALSRGQVAFLLLGLMLTAVFIRLGIWQLERHNQRLEANALLDSRRQAQTLDLNGDLPQATALAYRRAKAQGTFDMGRQILVKNRTLDGQPGYHLVTPLQLTGSDQSILVDRGWIPFEMARSLDEYALEGEVSVFGLLRPSIPEPGLSLLADPTPLPGESLEQWRVVNIERIQEQIPYELLPVFMEIEPDDAGDLRPPIPDPDLELGAGPHLGYAVQWFAFALISVIGLGLWIRNRDLQGS